MIQRLLLFIFTIFLSSFSMGQEIYPELTKKIKGFKDSTVLTKIDNIYKYEVKKAPKNEILLKFWKFTLYDSLKYNELRDTICLELLLTVSKIKYSNSSRLFLFAGLIKIEEVQFEKAIALYHQGLKIAKKYKDYNEASILLKNIGMTYSKVKDFKTAEKYLREALYIAEKFNIDLQITNSCISLGNALKGQNDFLGALFYYNKSLEIALKINEPKIIANCYNNIGNIIRRQNNQNEALVYYQKALDVNIKSGSKANEAMNYSNIAVTYTELGQYNMAIKFSKLAIEITKDLKNNLNLVSYYEVLSEAYAKNGDFENAYLFLNKQVQLKDSLNLTEQANMLKGFEAKYQSEKKQTEIKHLKMSNELQNVKNDSLKMQASKNQNILLLSVLALISLSIGLAVLYKTNKRRKQTNKILYTKNNEIEESNNSLQLALNALSIKNKEVIDSINYATYIQQAALPNISQISTDEVGFQLLFVPKDIVSGDFYFSYKLFQKSFFGVADCTGHGVPGAMVSLVGMNALDKVVREEKHETSCSIIESFNNHVKGSLNRGGESTNDGMDISFCYFNHENNMLHFTGANHSALILRNTQELDIDPDNDKISIRLQNETFSLIQLSGVRRPIGKSISQEPFYEVNFKMVKKDRIVLVTDGFADQTGGEKNKKLKKGTFLSMLMESSAMTVKDQIDHMRTGFELWKGDHEQIDDVCLLIVEVLS